ncbi:hypothetical protein SAMN05216323_101644 [Williamwhitmania taraxaci]|uniref:Uncharacterized protein n=1 Tax=Williamwhitmania taraxaci TaxID=1640674 RepID=A0A1G6ILK1_9BACT|nr:hypothetical protein SAMN05216323_101644 [Williamwhitmania taraxaci]
MVTSLFILLIMIDVTDLIIAVDYIPAIVCILTASVMFSFILQENKAKLIAIGLPIDLNTNRYRNTQ